MKTLFTSLLLLPLFILLHHQNALFGFITWQQAFLFLFITYATAALIWLIAFVISKKKPLSTLITIGCIVWSTYFGVFHDGAKYITATGWLSSYTVFIPLSLLLLFMLIRVISKTPLRLEKWTRYLNLLIIMFLLVEAGQSGLKLYQLSKTNNLLSPVSPLSQQYTSCNLADSLKPDIYFLVFDEYTSNNALQNVWHFNNQPFTSYLTEKGFYVIDNSHANYNFTPLSLGSTLNMEFMDLTHDNSSLLQNGFSALHTLQAAKSISHNATVALLQKERYNLHFYIPFKNDIENIGLVCEFGDFGYKQLYSHTFPYRIEQDILWHFPTAATWWASLSNSGVAYNNMSKRLENIDTTIAKIKSAVNQNANRPPNFVYGHFMITHSPHLFTADGQPRPLAEILSDKDLMKTYTDQVTKANAVVHDLVNHIQQYNKKNTVIIIEGDHGFKNLPASLTHYQFDNLHAIYFPDQQYAMLYKSMSPVNTFRTVFNRFFCQQFPLLKDSSIAIKFAQ